MEINKQSKPEKWGIIPFGNICKLVRGPFGGALKKEIFVSSGYKVYEQKHAIYNNFTLGSYYVDKIKYEQMKRFSLAPDDIIMSCSGTAGKTAIFPKHAQNGIINQALLKITANKTVIDVLFLSFFLKSDLFQKKLFEDFAGGAIKNLVGMPSIKRIQILSPPLPEQKKIAAILSSVDDAIEKTERLIQKLKDLKTALMQELFTHGIGHTEFKIFAQISRIPKSWKIVKIEDVADVEYGLGGALDKSIKKGLKIITLSNININGELSVENIHFVDENTPKAKKCILQKGDLLFNWRNGSIEHIGKTAFFNLNGRFTHVSFLLKVRAKENLVSKKFLFHMFTFYRKIGIFGSAKNQVNKTYNSTELKMLEIPLPDSDEQLRIANIIDSVDSKILPTVAKLNKLIETKKSLMQSLLTGKVRVKV